MLKLAALILGAREIAGALGCVATVGKTRILPNGVNAIPSAVSAWLDGRGPDEDAVRQLAPRLELALCSTASTESFTSNTEFDPVLARDLALLLGDVPIIGTGAGHDAGILSAAGTQSAMLFVRNPTGISHSPAEHADCDAGVAGWPKCCANWPQCDQTASRA